MRTCGLANDKRNAQLVLSQIKNALALKSLNFCRRQEELEGKSVAISSDVGV